MISNSQISDFAKRKTEGIEMSVGRELTPREFSQCRAFFNHMGSEFQRHESRGAKMDFNAFEGLHAPDVVKRAYEIERNKAAA